MVKREGGEELKLSSLLPPFQKCPSSETSERSTQRNVCWFTSDCYPHAQKSNHPHQFPLSTPHYHYSYSRAPPHYGQLRSLLGPGRRQ